MANRDRQRDTPTGICRQRQMETDTGRHGHIGVDRDRRGLTITARGGHILVEANKYSQVQTEEFVHGCMRP